MAEDRLIPVLAMTLDPRLRRLFALVGLCLKDEDWGLYDQEEALYDIMLDLAPEYLPPDEPIAEDEDQWRELVDAALAGTPSR